MTAQLSSPFCQAALPEVKRPAEVLAVMVASPGEAET